MSKRKPPRLAPVAPKPGRKPTTADAVRSIVAAHPELRKHPARVAVLASRDGVTVSRQAASAAMAASATQGRPRNDAGAMRVRLDRAAIDADANSRRLTGFALRWRCDDGPLAGCRATIAAGRLNFVKPGHQGHWGYMFGDVESCARYCVALGFVPVALEGGE